MGLTSPTSLPYPEYSDAPDGPNAVRGLAEAVDAGFYNKTDADNKYRTQADSYGQAEVDSRTPSTEFSGAARMHVGQVADTPGAGGSLTILHGCSWTPDYIMATASDTDASLVSAGGLTCNVARDTIDSDSFDVRVMKNAGASGHNQACRVTFLCFKNLGIGPEVWPATDRYTAGDWVALILAATLGATLLVTTVAILVFGKDITDAGARLLTTIGAGLVGSLSVYIGRTIARNGKRADDEPPTIPPP